MNRNLWIAAGGAALVIALGAFIAVFVMPLRRDALVGAGYAAKTVCSCLYVQERTLGACRGDLPPGLDGAALAVNEKSRKVRATLVGVFSRSARAEEGFGCRLD